MDGVVLAALEAVNYGRWTERKGRKLRFARLQCGPVSRSGSKSGKR